LSQDDEKLYNIKSREKNKPFIKVFNDFKTLQKQNYRIPHNQKALVRRSKRTTFIVKNKAFRVSKNRLNSQILRELTWSYSTSANKSGESFDRLFCEDKADIIIEDSYGLKEKSSSRLLKLNNIKIRKLR
jgi:tRNA A37 threonylcarbamoyladenosine synthetase subunit TsaC/SUA5/YrdC